MIVERTNHITLIDLSHPKVDASIFPNIPGYFITVPLYAAAQKAANVIEAVCIKFLISVLCGNKR